MKLCRTALTEISEIYDILERCDSLSLGISGEDYPYVIPMTFGCSLEDGKITVYLHSAGDGKKAELLARDNRVCVEAHLYYRVEQTEGGVTARFESVVGTGTAERLTETEDKVKAFRVILAHYHSSGFPVTGCKGLPRAEVYRIVLEEVQGKRSL